MPINAILPLFMAAQNSIKSKLFGYLILTFRIISNFLLYCNLHKLSCNEHPVLKPPHASSALAREQISKGMQPAREPHGSTHAGSERRERTSSSCAVLRMSPFLRLLCSEHAADDASDVRDARCRPPFLPGLGQPRALRGTAPGGHVGLRVGSRPYPLRRSGITRVLHTFRSFRYIIQI